MSQTMEVLSWLKSKPITALEALQALGCMRLGARVYELRNMGYNIVTDRFPVKNSRGTKAVVGRYRLIPQGEQK